MEDPVPWDKLVTVIEHDTDHWRAVVSMVMNFRVHERKEIID
jgi:hypothetical protein